MVMFRFVDNGDVFNHVGQLVKDVNPADVNFSYKYVGLDGVPVHVSRVRTH